MHWPLAPESRFSPAGPVSPEFVVACLSLAGGLFAMAVVAFVLL
jgi:hypothetical protein